VFPPLVLAVHIVPLTNILVDAIPKALGGAVVSEHEVVLQVG